MHSDKVASYVSFQAHAVYSEAKRVNPSDHQLIQGMHEIIYVLYVAIIITIAVV